MNKSKCSSDRSSRLKANSFKICLTNDTDCSYKNMEAEVYKNIFDEINNSDIIPRMSEPKAYNEFKFWTPLTKTVLLVNQIILTVIIVYYFTTFGRSVSFSKTLKSNSLTEKLEEIHWELDLLSKKVDAVINTWLSLDHRTNDFSCEQYIDNKIDKAIQLYDADKVGLKDYALESGGATVISTPKTESYPLKLALKLFGIFNVNINSNPQTLIQPGVLSGQCYAFKGSRGIIRIRLSGNILITSVAMENADYRLMDDISGTPKAFKVYGLHDSKRNLLGKFTYEIPGKRIQIFPVDIKNASYNIVELNILNNYGNLDYTCVYRFRVHGIKFSSDDLF